MGNVVKWDVPEVDGSMSGILAYGPTQADRVIVDVLVTGDREAWVVVTDPHGMKLELVGCVVRGDVLAKAAEYANRVLANRA